MKPAIIASAVLACGLALSTGAEAFEIPTCKFSNGQQKMIDNGRDDQARRVGASRNTNAGKGNGGEVYLDSFFFLGLLCYWNIPGEDIEEIDIDANDCGGYIATDPGNSAQDDSEFSEFCSLIGDGPV